MGWKQQFQFQEETRNLSLCQGAETRSGTGAHSYPKGTGLYFSGSTAVGASVSSVEYTRKHT